MPTISRFFIKAGMLFFLASFITLFLTEMREFLNLPPEIAYIRPVFLHMLMVGWITQIILGVSIWMFPIRGRQNPRGRESWQWGAFVLLNVGLLLRVVSEPMIALHRDFPWTLLIILSAVLQWAAVCLYVADIWSRVKGRSEK
ncbi:MAG: hypothetical protein KDI06_10800 [Calditrichaeota bacterium]|nr:hypothetical protein [Calditrichota bacterium]